MRIIVAIDIIGGKCVRLTRGDFNTRKVYSEDPLEVALRIRDNGIRHLHLVDLDGAKNRKIMNLNVLERIAAKTSLKIDFSGGIRTDADIRSSFDCGASQVSCGSVAVTEKDLFLGWLTEFGADRIILAADCIGRKVSISGWTQNSDIDIISFVSDYVALGVKYSICTDIDRDGMLHGPSAGLYKEILESAPHNLIASGGISTLEDIADIKEAGCEGAIIGKAVYEGRLTLEKLGTLC
jgi:phosphoribosylformimino-5-aminoimidazole carboxamide ribotide isomerase